MIKNKNNRKPRLTEFILEAPKEGLCDLGMKRLSQQWNRIMRLEAKADELDKAKAGTQPK